MRIGIKEGTRPTKWKANIDFGIDFFFHFVSSSPSLLLVTQFIRILFLLLNLLNLPVAHPFLVYKLWVYVHTENWGRKRNKNCNQISHFNGNLERHKPIIYRHAHTYHSRILIDHSILAD